MEGKTHTSVGAATGLVMSLAFSTSAPVGYEKLIVGVGASIVGALFADLDLDHSNGSKLLNKILAVVVPTVSVIVILAVMGLIDLSKSKFNIEQIVAAVVFLGIGIFARTRPHREFTHSLFCMVITMGCVLVIEQGELWMWYLAGYASHLVIDLLNNKGESLLWPLDTKVCFGLCSAGGVVNSVLYYVGITVSILIVVVKEGAAFG